MKKFRKIKISFTTTEIIASPDEAARRSANTGEHNCPLCHSPLAGGVRSNTLVLTDGADNREPSDTGPIAKHDCR